MKKKIRFIINPISGGVKKAKVPQMIEEHLDQSLPQISVYHLLDQWLSQRFFVLESLSSSIQNHLSHVQNCDLLQPSQYIPSNQPTPPQDQKILLHHPPYYSKKFL